MKFRQPSRRSSLTLVLIFLLAMAGCANHYVNEPLVELDPEMGYRFTHEIAPDR